MKLVKCIVRPNKVDEVKDALMRVNISGMTVSEVRGHGRQKGHKAIYRGREYEVSLLPKMMIDIVTEDGMVDDIVKVVIEAARTGEIGDGRIFVLPVEEGYNIRTGERDIT
ncbi:MAG: P-II family nitrogen regulator [Acidobacteria bacterium]|nr:P-II family nitrogen regulator [Acidobacteriota bacterium]